MIDKQIWPIGGRRIGPDCSIGCLEPSVNNCTRRKRKGYWVKTGPLFPSLTQKSAEFPVGHTSVDGNRKKVQIFLEILNEKQVVVEYINDIISSVY